MIMTRSLLQIIRNKKKSPKVMNAKKCHLKRHNGKENSKFHLNGNFDILTACHEIKFDEL